MSNGDSKSTRDALQKLLKYQSRDLEGLQKQIQDIERRLRRQDGLGVIDSLSITGDAAEIRAIGEQLEQIGAKLRVVGSSISTSAVESLPLHGTVEGTEGFIREDLQNEYGLMEDGFEEIEAEKVISKANDKKRATIETLCEVDVRLLKQLRSYWRRETEVLRQVVHPRVDTPADLIDKPREEALIEYVLAGFKSSACDLLIHADSREWTIGSILRATELPGHAAVAKEKLQELPSPSAKRVFKEVAKIQFDEYKKHRSINEAFARHGFGPSNGSRNQKERVEELEEMTEVICYLHDL